jgi:hypothetical protein
MIKTPKYWVTLCYELFMTYEKVNSEHEGSPSSNRVRTNVSDAKIDEPKVSTKKAKR